MEKKFMYVDDIAVELNGEKNVLEVIRKAGIDMPTLCYHPSCPSTAHAVCACLKTSAAVLMLHVPHSPVPA